MKPRTPPLTPTSGFPGYAASRDGKIWSFWVYQKRPRRIGSAARELRGSLDKDGYRRLTLYRDGRRSYFHVQTLVLNTFVGPCPDGMGAAHNNGIRQDNRARNLRWDTQKNNIADKRRHGTDQVGERNGMHHLTEQQVRDIRQRRAVGESCVDMATIFGVSLGTISSVCTRRIWRHVR